MNGRIDFKTSANFSSKQGDTFTEEAEYQKALEQIAKQLEVSVTGTSKKYLRLSDAQGTWVVDVQKLKAVGIDENKLFEVAQSTGNGKNGSNKNVFLSVDDLKALAKSGGLTIEALNKAFGINTETPVETKWPENDKNVKTEVKTLFGDLQKASANTSITVADKPKLDAIIKLLQEKNGEVELTAGQLQTIGKVLGKDSSLYDSVIGKKAKALNFLKLAEALAALSSKAAPIATFNKNNPKNEAAQEQFAKLVDSDIERTNEGLLEHIANGKEIRNVNEANAVLKALGDTKTYTPGQMGFGVDTDVTFVQLLDNVKKTGSRISVLNTAKETFEKDSKALAAFEILAKDPDFASKHADLLKSLAINDYVVRAVDFNAIKTALGDAVKNKDVNFDADKVAKFSTLVGLLTKKTEEVKKTRMYNKNAVLDMAKHADLAEGRFDTPLSIFSGGDKFVDYITKKANNGKGIFDANGEVSVDDLVTAMKFYFTHDKKGKYLAAGKLRDEGDARKLFNLGIDGDLNLNAADIEELAKRTAADLAKKFLSGKGQRDGMTASTVTSNQLKAMFREVDVKN